MKYLGSLILAVAAIVVVAFSVTNMQAAPLNPWPFADPIEAPVYLIVLLSLLCGFACGALLVWIVGFPRRRRAARQRREGAKMQAELDQLRGRPSTSTEVAARTGADTGASALPPGRSAAAP